LVNTMSTAIGSKKRVLGTARSSSAASSLNERFSPSSGISETLTSAMVPPRGPRRAAVGLPLFREGYKRNRARPLDGNRQFPLMPQAVARHPAGNDATPFRQKVAD